MRAFRKFVKKIKSKILKEILSFLPSLVKTFTIQSGLKNVFFISFELFVAASNKFWTTFDLSKRLPNTVMPNKLKRSPTQI